MQDQIVLYNIIIPVWIIDIDLDIVRISRALLHRVYRIIKRLLLVLVVQYFYTHYIISIHSYAQIEQLVVMIYVRRQSR